MVPGWSPAAVTVLLAVITVAAWGTWIPVVHLAPAVPERARLFFVTVGNAVVAVMALFIGGQGPHFGWKAFWLPVAGGAVWVAGNYSAFRASRSIGMARANGTWAPLNIVVSFVWGALLFGELNRTSTWRLVVLGGAGVLMVAGVLYIVSSADARSAPPVAGMGEHTKGLLFAVAAGGLWGSYFIPSQWAGVAAQVGNLPLAVGMLMAGTVASFSGRPFVPLGRRAIAVALVSGGLWGIGNIALLGLVHRVGTGVGFTLAQLALPVTAGLGIYVFKVPPPGSSSARRAVLGIVLAGAGGLAIGAFR